MERCPLKKRLVGVPKIRRKMVVKVLLKCVSLLAFAAMTAPLFSQTVTEDFTDNSAPDWTFGGTTTPVLTGDGVIDPVGQGYLRLTPLTGNQATYAYYNGTPLDSANRSFYGSFDFVTWNQGGIGAADGIVFYLYDGSQAFAEGANGGSIGYAQKTGVPGKPGGYMGLAIDDWGNYSNPTEGRVGGPGFIPNAIAVRGPGSGTSGYEFIAGTGDGTNPALTTDLDFPSATSRPNTAADYRHLEFTLSPTGELIVYLQIGTGALTPVLTADLSGYTRPETLGFGYSSGTGAAYSYHEIRNFSLTSLVANLWDNGNGNSLWGTNTNWYPDALPVAGGDVLFDNTFVTTSQNVDLGATTRQIRSVSFDGSVAYTLSNGTLNFDSGTSAPVTLSATDTGGANANHTISANITTAADWTISNNLDSAYSLTISGTVDNNGNNILATGTGNTTISGVISDTGALTKTDVGTLTLSGNNTYSGGTSLQLGTIAMGHNNALGSGALSITGGTLEASGGSRTIGNTTSLAGNVTVGGANNIDFTGTWTQTGADRTITVSNSGTTTFGNIVLAENNQTRTLTMDVGAGGATVSGVISDGTGSGADGFTKNGTGTLVLSGANTYTGTTTINAGTIQIGASDRISDSSAMNLAGGTIDLNGSYSERVANLSFNNGTIDFGTAGTNNNFMFNDEGTVAGSLIVSNWDSAGDHLAYLTANGPLSAGFLDAVYFSGYGSGSQVLAPDNNQTITGYGGAVWSFITPLVSNYDTWDGGSGTSNNWNAGGGVNWVDNSTPVSGTTLRIAFDGNTRLTPNMNANYTVNALRFETTAGAFTLGSTSGRTLTFDGTAPSLMQLSSNDQTISNAIALNQTTIMDITGAGTMTLSGVVSGAGGINKVGTSTLILSGNNTFTGNVNINEGVVNVRNSNGLGATSGDTFVANGAALELQNNISVGAGESLSMTGTGVSGNGALRNISGNNTWAGAVTLTGDTRVQSDAGTLTMSGGVSGNYDLNVGGAGNITMSGAITTGANTLTKDGAGTVTLSGGGANTFTGDATVNAGTLILGKTAGVNAIAGDLYIGDGAGTDTVQLTASNQIADASVVNLASSGVWDLNNFSETISGLNSVSTASQVQLGTGTLTVNSFENSSFAGVISETGAVVKQGANTLTLTGANTYTGTTTVSAGVLNIQHATALGTTAAGTSVTSGAALQLEGGIAIGAEALTLNGTGVSSNGALRNISGNNSWAGAVTLGSATRINSDAGTLTMSGNFGGAQNLTVGGAGNTVLSGVLGTGAGTLTKDGAGTLTLSGGAVNTFSGAVTINAGTLDLAKSGALNNAGNNVTVNSGGTLLFSGTSTTRMSNTAGITLAGGTLTAQDVTETVGTLTLTAASVINLGTDAGNDDLTFANLTDTGGSVVIYNWSGNQYSSGTDDRIFVTGAAPGTIFADVTFNGFNQGAIVLASRELVPIPEPGTVLGGILIAGLFAFRWWQRRRVAALAL